MIRMFLLVNRMAIQELSNRYKWSKLGVIWPFFSFLIYVMSVSLVYSKIFSLETKVYLPYLASGMLSWIFVQSFYVEGISLLSAYKGFIININLPFSYYISVMILRNFYLFLLQLPVLFLVNWNTHSEITKNIFFLPICLIPVMLWGFLIAGILAPLGIVFKDLVHLIPSVATILSLITPILYPISVLENASWLYEYNPFFYLVSLIREPLLGQIPKVNYFLITFFIIIILIPFYVIINKILDRKIVPII